MGVGAGSGVDYQLHRSLSWMTPYMIDYGICHKPLTLIRCWSIALRWYDEPDIRLEQLANMRTYLPEAKRFETGQLAFNLGVLLESDVQLYPHHDPGGFAFFLSALQFGSVLTGGSLPSTLDPLVARIRPGFAFVFELWSRYLPDDPCPWPFWLFPRADELEAGRWLT